MALSMSLEMDPQLPQTGPTQSGPGNKADSTLIKPLRTYERDIADLIRSQNVSVVDVNLAQRKREEERHEKRVVIAERTEKFTRNTIFLTLGLILVGVSSVVFLVIFLMNKNPEPQPAQVQIISTFIPHDQEKEFDLSTLSTAQVAQRFSLLSDEKYPDDSVTRIKIIEREKTGAADAEAGIFLASAAPRIPASLVRSFGKDIFAGIYTYKEINHPFFIIQIDSFNNAFDGMLLWEKTMHADLKSIVADRGNTKPLSGTPLENFTDVIVQNKDTRMLRDDQGEVRLMYSFIDDHTLFIVDKEITFREILNRSAAAKLIR